MDWHEQSRPTRLQQAISTGRFEIALAAARRERFVPLEDAAALIHLGRDRDYDYYSRMCVRWIDRLLHELNPSIEDLHGATHALICLPEQPVMLDRLLKLAAYRRYR